MIYLDTVILGALYKRPPDTLVFMCIEPTLFVKGRLKLIQLCNAQNVPLGHWRELYV